MGQLFSQFDCYAIGIPSGTKGQLIQLVFDGLNNGRVGKSHLVDVVAVKVHITPALQVFDVNPLAVA